MWKTILILLFCFPNTVRAFQFQAVPTDSLVALEFKQSLSLINSPTYIRQKEELLGQLFTKSFYSGALLINDVLKVIYEDNLESYLLNVCGKNVDKLSPSGQARVLLLMGDAKSSLGQPYEALLSYSKAEKKVKDSPLAYEAKWRTAKAYYYAGDFDLAKELLDILKQGTDREIANDALNLSMFLDDHLGIDSLEKDVRQFVQIQKLQNFQKWKAADEALEQFVVSSPQENLIDDLLYLRAQRALLKKEFPLAKSLFLESYQKFPLDIYADDSLYKYLELDQFKDEKLGFQFIQQFPSSLFVDVVRSHLMNPKK
jgi:tetratricopeptide (TPR) repeat protein